MFLADDSRAGFVSAPHSIGTPTPAHAHALIHTRTNTHTQCTTHTHTHTHKHAHTHTHTHKHTVIAAQITGTHLEVDGGITAVGAWASHA
jgi:hypothetical protein